MKPFLCLLVALLLNCKTQSANNLGPERTEPAFIYANSLATDGCEEFVRLDHGNPSADARYKPTANSLPILQKAMASTPAGTSPYERSVTIRFAETGKQVPLQCGWGSRPEVGEIEIIAIRDR